jgi:Alginate export
MLQIAFGILMAFAIGAASRWLDIPSPGACSPGDRLLTRQPSRRDARGAIGVACSRRRALGLAAAIMAMSALVAHAQEPRTANAPEPPSISSLRYTENYSYLRNPANRSGAWWESYKFIPLDSDAFAFLTLGNETRLRYERYWNNEFGSGPKPSEGYLWFRDLPYADLHIGPNFRAFGQLIAAYADRSHLTKGPVDETGIDLLQGFVDWRLPLAEGAATLRGGRQVMIYGSERLISTRYGPNVLRAFDGGLGRWEAGDWRVDAFFVRPVENNLHSFDDRTDGSRKMWSLYATRSLPEIGTRAGLDLFYIGYGNKAAEFNQGGGREIRHTMGTRFFGASGPWKWDLEGHLQYGNFAGGDIRAWSVATDVRYTFADVPLKPYLELRANAISGDANPNDRTLGTFNALFPRGKYFGEIGQVGPANLINVHPVIGIDLGYGWSLSGALVFYWRESLGDGVYGTAGNLLRPSRDSRSRYIGTQADVVLGWEAARNLSFEMSYSIFEPGQFIKDTGPSKTVHFIGAETLFRF